MNSFYETLSEINPNAQNIALTVLSKDKQGAKCLVSAEKIAWESDSFFSEHADETLAVSGNGIAQIAGLRVFAEVLGQEKKFVICGAGHISMPLIAMIRMLGCPVTVIDDRPYFADNARRAQATTVYCEPFEEALAKIPGDDDTFFIIVTRGHRYDEACLSAIVRKPHAYIGMIGSRRRVGFVKESVIEGGGDPEVVSSVHTPIGLNIGAQTPEEIAIAIMAEIIQVKNAVRRTGGYPREIVRELCGDNRFGNHCFPQGVCAARRGHQDAHSAGRPRHRHDRRRLCRSGRHAPGSNDAHQPAGFPAVSVDRGRYDRRSC